MRGTPKLPLDTLIHLRKKNGTLVRFFKIYPKISMELKQPYNFSKSPEALQNMYS